MSPTAVTPAARRVKSSPADGGDRPRSPHPSTPRSPHRTPRARAAVAPRVPRRVSGPARPGAAPRASATVAVPTRATTRSAPGTRRARELAVEAPRRSRALTHRDLQQLGHRALVTLRALPDHSLLDRVVRGRLWIPLLGVLLVGIVTGQVEVLKLNASIGSSVVRSQSLTTANQLLRSRISRLSDDQRIEARAARLNLSMPPVTQQLFMSGSVAVNLGRAMANIHAPDPTAFAAATSQRAAARAAEVTYSSGQ